MQIEKGAMGETPNLILPYLTWNRTARSSSSSSYCAAIPAADLMQLSKYGRSFCGPVENPPLGIRLRRPSRCSERYLLRYVSTGWRSLPPNLGASGQGKPRGRGCYEAVS